ncbi:hypothetical protein AAC387_Pa01g3018 [Persea americana]
MTIYGRNLHASSDATSSNDLPSGFEHLPEPPNIPTELPTPSSPGSSPASAQPLAEPSSPCSCPTALAPPVPPTVPLHLHLSLGYHHCQPHQENKEGQQIHLPSPLHWPNYKEV